MFYPSHVRLTLKNIIADSPQLTTSELETRLRGCLRGRKIRRKQASDKLPSSFVPMTSSQDPPEIVPSSEILSQAFRPNYRRFAQAMRGSECCIERAVFPRGNYKKTASSSKPTSTTIAFSGADSYLLTFVQYVVIKCPSPPCRSTSCCRCQLRQRAS